MTEVSREAFISKINEVFSSEDASLGTIRTLVDFTTPLGWSWYPVPTFCGIGMTELIWEVNVQNAQGKTKVELDVRLTNKRTVWISNRSKTARLGAVDLAKLTITEQRRKKTITE